MYSKSYTKGNYKVTVNYLNESDIHNTLKESLDDSIIPKLLKEGDINE